MTDYRPIAKEHCNHERLCVDLTSYLRCVLPPNKCPIMKCKDSNLDFQCPHDTRSHPLSEHDVEIQKTKIPLRGCFGDYDDCPCDDECIIVELCSAHCNLKNHLNKGARSK